MNEEIFDQYCEAGRIAKKILHHAGSMVEVGARIIDVVETIEQEIGDEGAGIAFPLNISLNENAAHDTAGPGDERTFSTGDLVKVDMGVHLDGYIADTALTVDLGTNDLLVDASRAALEAAIACVKPGASSGELGAAIQQEIESRGYRPVVNLTGHGLDRYDLHTSPSIPNIAIRGGVVLEEGMVFAIEPFASTGTGHVSESHRVEIFRQIAVKPVRMAAAKRLLEHIRGNHGLPFSRRWIPENKVDLAIATLRKSQMLHAFPVLHDVSGSLVSQAEHTIIVTEDGCIVTTR